ncbi:hypothetical protein QBC42DRAFT_284111 [Cladorrhinum samala]|uniref:Uncharacterized protein n=1 Tax=Cladorrhinum samala TaxID=585594 RepID=A0AAV9HVS0_9PEZI|nr:hypothetical protein QBC42DRAFT_284111 [Cladorrhinum samala]
MRVIQLSILLFAVAATAVHTELVQAGTILLERQAPGTPQFQCHSDCGNALAGGRNPAHCDNATWTGLYEACLGCALTFDIWKHYGQGLTGAASACSLTPTPLPSGVASSSSGSSPSSTGTSVTTTNESTASITSAPTTPSESAAPAGATSTTATSAASKGLVLGRTLSLAFWVTIAFGIQAVL